MPKRRRFRIPFEGVNGTGAEQPGDFQGQGPRASPNIPDKGIGPWPEVGQQHHPQLHGGWAEARSIFKDTIG